MIRSGAYRSCWQLAAVMVVASALATGGSAPAGSHDDLPGPEAEDPLARFGRDAEAQLAPPPAADLDELRAQIARLVRQTGRGGVAVAIRDRSGALWSEGFGPAGPDGRPMTADTLFRTGSLTKPFVSLGIMRLVEQGRLRLEDPVKALAPELAIENRWERTDPVRVAHLLEHTAGFDEMRFNEIFDPDGSQDRPLADVLAVNPRSRTVRWRPGTRFSYSQPGYTVAAYLIEKVTGLRYERFLEEEVFAPLGVQGASLRLTPDVRARLATGQERGRPVPPVMLLHRPAGNLMISAAGLARLMALYIGRGEIDGQRYLQPASIERIESCGTLPHAGKMVCYGLGNWGDLSGAIPMRGHGGYVPGYWGFFRYSHHFGFGLAVLSNDIAAGRLVDRVAVLLSRYLAAGLPLPTPPRAPAPSQPLDQYLGSFRLASPPVEFLRFQTDVYGGVRVVEQRGQLYVERNGRLGRLVPTGPDQFRFPRDNGTSVVFGRSPEGRLSLTLRGGYFERESAWWAQARRVAMELATLLLFSSLLAPALLPACKQRQQVTLVLLPLASALCLFGMSWAFGQAREQGLLGEATPLTVLVWLFSLAFGLAAQQSLVRVLGGWRVGLPLGIRLHALLVAAAAAWVALHLARYGLIGLRTWQW